jgi:hypothetical protein
MRSVDGSLSVDRVNPADLLTARRSNADAVTGEIALSNKQLEHDETSDAT